MSFLGRRPPGGGIPRGGRETLPNGAVRELLDSHPTAALWVLWKLHRYGTYRNAFEQEELPWEMVKDDLERSLADCVGPGKPNMLAFLAEPG